MKNLNTLLFALIIMTAISCSKDKVSTEITSYTDAQYALISQTLDLPQHNFDYTINLPLHLGGFPIRTDNAKATLGRVLFYDKNLSKNKKVSCASCHEASKAFSDSKAFSEGFDGGLTKRNSLALAAFPSFNAYYGFSGTSFFWDERVQTVREQAQASIEDDIEMGIPFHELETRLASIDYYKVLFDEIAFPIENFEKGISYTDKAMEAIESFVNSIGTFDSEYDRERLYYSDASTDFSNFTPAENLGKRLYLQNCNTCHSIGSGTTVTITAANNGLDMVYADKGVGEITRLVNDNGVFKLPMLRNIALTAPYMHDGRFETLEEVIDHYSTGLADHPNLHEELRRPDGSPRNLNFNAEEKQALIAFLHTLTDKESVMHEKYSDPFK